VAALLELLAHLLQVGLQAALAVFNYSRLKTF